MEFGGITPIGLPSSWQILVDSAVVDVSYAVVGSGLRRSKLLVPGKSLVRLPGVQVAEGLAGLAGCEILGHGRAFRQTGQTGQS